MATSARHHAHTIQGVSMKAPPTMKNDGSEVYAWLLPDNQGILLWMGEHGNDDWVIAPVIARGTTTDLGPIIQALTNGN